MSEPPKPPPPSTAKKADPGWNDPPMLNYSAVNPPPKSRIGNKRIAFPIGGNLTRNSGASPSVSPLTETLPKS